MPAGSAEAVTALIEDAMARELSDVMGETRGIVIIHQGRLVAEAYRDGFTPETKQISWSMAKSVTHALVGRAVHLGLIKDIDAAMPSPFEEDDPRRLITWRQWLNMTDGLDYHEIDAGDDLENNDVVQMMFGRGRFDVIQYVVDELEPAHAPGTHWNYSTAGFHMISRAFQYTFMPEEAIASLKETPEFRSMLRTRMMEHAPDDPQDRIEYETEIASMTSKSDDELIAYLRKQTVRLPGMFRLIGMDAPARVRPRRHIPWWLAGLGQPT